MAGKNQAGPACARVTVDYTCVMKKTLDTGRTNLLMAAFLASPDMIAISSLNTGHFLEVNDAFVTQSGYAREEVIGQSSLDLDMWCHAGDRDAFKAALERDGSVQGFTTRLKPKGKAPRLYQLSGSTIDLPSEKERVLVTAFRDISASEEAENALKKTAFLLERAEEMAKIGSWEFDFRTKVVTSSEGSARIYGVPRDGLTVDFIESVPLPEYREAMDSARDDLIRKGVPYDIEFKIKRHSDGAILDIRSQARWDPETLKLFGIIRDVTDERAVERGLREVISQRDALIHELYHRTANTLQTILSMVRLDEGFAGDPGYGRFLSRMARRVEAMAIVHDGLFEARNPSRLAVREFLPKIMEVVRGSSGADVEYDLGNVELAVDAAVPCGIIVAEIAENAFEHGGATRITLSASRDQSGVTIHVSDNGKGPAPGWTPDALSNRGILLAKALGEGQLKGIMRFDGPPGLSCELGFPDKLTSAHSGV